MAILAAVFLGSVALVIVSRLSGRRPAPVTPAQTEHAGLVAALPEQDWPHLRGPHYNAVAAETDLAESWPTAGPPILWTRELGQGYSGFTVVAGKVYTQKQTVTGQYVVCLDALTGDQLWQSWYDWSWQPASVYPGPYATPTWHDGKIYYAAPNGLVGCLDATTGQSSWSINVIKQFHGRGTEFGYACTPLVEDGKVILPVGGRGASVIALDLKTGRQIWKQSLSAEYDEHAAWPLYDDPNLLIAAPFHAGSHLFRLDQDGEKVRPQLVWASRELSNDVCSSVLVAGHVYGFDLKAQQAEAHRTSRGEFKCLEFATGRVCWTTDRVGHATVLAADGKLLLFNDTGTLILAHSNPQKYDELGRVQLFSDGVCWTPPALDHGRLFLRTQSRAACVFLGRPEQLAPEQAQRATVAANIPSSGDARWVKILSREPEYPNDAPTKSEVALWFAFCLVGVFGVAALATGLVYVAKRLRWLRIALPGEYLTFWFTSFVLGLLGTTLYSAYWDTFVLTWPASLFVAYQMTIAAVICAERQPVTARARWISRLTTLVFLALCFGYYQLCKTVGVVMGWSFLIGFLPAFPMSTKAARHQNQRSHLLFQVFWTFLAFLVYFWTSGLFPAWKVSLFEGGE